MNAEENTVVSYLNIHLLPQRPDHHRHLQTKKKYRQILKQKKLCLDHVRFFSSYCCVEY